MTPTSYDALRDHLVRECGLLVRALRRQSVRDWSRRCPPFADRAAAAAHVAQVLADAGLAVEAVTTGRGTPRPLPAIPPHALADAVAVCAADLAESLVAADPAAATDAGTVEHVAASVLAEVLLHRHDLDGAAPGPRTSAAVLTALGEPAADSPPRAVLAQAAGRCAVPRGPATTRSM